MDIEHMTPRLPDDGPTTGQVVEYLSGIETDDGSVYVLAVLAVQVSRAIDRCASTGAGISVIPNMAKQLRETLAEIRQVLEAKLDADDGLPPSPFDQIVSAATSVTPSLFAGAPR